MIHIIRVLPLPGNESLIFASSDRSTYALLTYDGHSPRYGNMRFFQMGKRVEDDIPNPLLQWAPDNTLRGGELTKVDDPLLAREMAYRQHLTGLPASARVTLDDALAVQARDSGNFFLATHLALAAKDGEWLGDLLNHAIEDDARERARRVTDGPPRPPRGRARGPPGKSGRRERAAQRRRLAAPPSSAVGAMYWRRGERSRAVSSRLILTGSSA